MRIKLLIATLVVGAASLCAKDIRTVVFTPDPPMSCHNCENKIKGNLRFEKGVKDIATNLEAQEITVTYDADKTSAEKLAGALDKIGYKATVAGDDQGDCRKCDAPGGKCCKSDKSGKK
ncbi:MAG: heavy-metal-associated domain-containing protein [Muribaculum sp.]|nr:heavy-metal-associated domain-containing protein [Muribaculum sp.]